MKARTELNDAGVSGLPINDGKYFSSTQAKSETWRDVCIVTSIKWFHYDTCQELGSCPQGGRALHEVRR
jgi:hypothetical protein